MDNKVINIYDYVQNKVYFLTQLIIICFTILLILYKEQVFGIQVAFISLRYNETVGETFKIITLLLVALANFIASNDHTTLCINAIYSIVLLFVVIAHCTFYIHLQREKLLIGKKKNKVKTNGFFVMFFKYCLLATIVSADCLYYNFPNKEWFLLCCLFVFLEIWNGYKFFVYSLGFVVYLLGFAVNAFTSEYTLFYWMVYLGFVVLTITFETFTWYASKNKNPCC